MNLFEELKAVAIRQNEEADFPLWLLTDVLDIANDPQRFADRADLVRLLITQIADFDSYAGAGCFDSSVSADTIKTTIREITPNQNAAMACEILDCCQFFKDNMKNLPKTAEYVRSKLCLGDHEKCNRYRTFMELDEDNLPSDLAPNDAEEVKKVRRCLRSKKLPE